jgi:hypothetical protein
MDPTARNSDCPVLKGAIPELGGNEVLGPAARLLEVLELFFVVGAAAGN